MDERIQTLISWGQENGVKLHPSVEVYQDELTGLSFRVKQDAQENVGEYETIISIPSTITLSFTDAVGEKSPFKNKEQLIARLEPHVIGRLMLMREYLQGKQSFWWPYIQALPQPAETDSWLLPPFWPEDEVALLKGTNVEFGIASIAENLKREFEDLQDTLGDGGDAELAAAATYELYSWAYAIFSSRSFRPSLVLSDEKQKSLPTGVKVDDFSVLMPLFDIGNHDITRPVRWELEKHDSCTLKIGKEHFAGEQIFNNYSMKSNAELLLGYGFMIPPRDDLHNDYIHLRKRAPIPGHAFGDEYFLSRRPMSDPSSIMIRSKLTPGMIQQADKTLLALQRVQPQMIWDIVTLVASPEQREALFPVQGKEGEEADEVRLGMLLSGTISEENKGLLEQVVGTIQGKLIQELEKLNEHDVEVDEEDLELLTRNQKLAIDYRQRCRVVLERALEAMDKDEYFY